MNKETFEKLQLPISTVNWSARVDTIFGRSSLERIIDIYVSQENMGGYLQKTDRS